LSLVVSVLLSPTAGAMTPTPGPTPRPTGDLGTKEVSGRVFDSIDGTAIAGAEVTYRNVQRFGSVETGSTVTDADGEFSFSLTLHDTDSISIEVSAGDYIEGRIDNSGYQLWIAPPLAIDLLPLRGTVEVAPNTGISLGCEGDGEVTISNSQPDGGEELTIVALWPGNSYSQGDYGTGFTWDISAIELPLTLAPGERVAFPVHYSASGQSFPSRLTIRMRSTAGESAGLRGAVPRRDRLRHADTHRHAGGDVDLPRRLRRRRHGDDRRARAQRRLGPRQPRRRRLRECRPRCQRHGARERDRRRRCRCRRGMPAVAAL
jgi:hypothetical protein